MAVFLSFTGAETQDFVECSGTAGSPAIETTIKRTGEASYKFASAATLAEINFTGLSLSLIRCRIWCYLTVGANPSASTAARLLTTAGEGNSTLRLDPTVATNGTITIQTKVNGGATNVGSAFAIPTDQWNVLEVYVKPSATVGEVTIKLNGTTVVTQTGLNTGTSTIVSDIVFLGPPTTNSLTATWYVDDFAYGDDATTGPAQAGRSILRKAKSGSPTYDAFTKTAAAAINTVWDDLPFSATDEAHSTAASQAQTALVDDVGAGTDPIGSADTINACKVVALIKRLTDGTGGSASQTRDPTGDGTFSGTWTGTAGTRWQLVDDHPDSAGTDLLTHGTATAGRGTFTYSAFTVPAGATIDSVQVLYYDRKTASQADSWGAFLRVGGVDRATNDAHNASTTRTLRTATYTTNPATSTAWTRDEVNGTAGSNNLEGFGVVATDANPSLELSSIQLVVNYTTAPVDGTYKIRRRVNGADTDTAKTLTTTDAYYDDGIWTTTLTNLQSMEFGAFRDAGGDHNMQVEDVYLLVDSTPGITTSFPPYDRAFPRALLVR